LFQPAIEEVKEAKPEEERSNRLLDISSDEEDVILTTNLSA
jgi:hypothetical protein